MELVVLLIVLQVVAALLLRYMGTALFPDGPYLDFGNRPPILRNPVVLNTLGVVIALLAVGVVVCAFVFTDYPWWLLLFVAGSLIWGSPPYPNWKRQAPTRD